jgi:hypothetical protein
MAVSWPQIVTHLVATLQSLPGWSDVVVFDGPPNTGDDPTDYCTVGWIDDDNAGSFGLEHTEDFLTTESGIVRGQIVAQSGDDVLTFVRARACALFDALDAHLRADQTLGGALGIAPTAILASDAMRPEVTSMGVVQTIEWSLAYQVQTPSS